MVCWDNVDTDETTLFCRIFPRCSIHVSGWKELLWSTYWCWVTLLFTTFGDRLLGKDNLCQWHLKDTVYFLVTVVFFPLPSPPPLCHWRRDKPEMSPLFFFSPTFCELLIFLTSCFVITTGCFHFHLQMSEDWVGCVVSINCGATLGHYQGQVTNLNQKEQTVTISQAYRNGRKSEIDNITIW